MRTCKRKAKSNRTVYSMMEQYGRLRKCNYQIVTQHLKTKSNKRRNKWNQIQQNKMCTCKQRDIFHEGEMYKQNKTSQSYILYCCIILISSYKQVKDMEMQQFPVKVK